jgi:hypothetical protein
MTLPLSNTAEGGTNGVAATTANSGGASGNAFTAFPLGTNTAINFSSAQAANGSLAYAIVEPPTTATAFMEWDSTVVGGPHVTLYGRLYLYLPAAPASAIYCMRLLSGTTSGAGLRINTTRGLQWANGTTAVGTASSGAGLIALNTWTRIEWTCTLATTAVGSGTATLYTGNSVSSNGTATVSAQTWAIASANVVRYGWTNVGGLSSTTSYFDDLQVNNTGLPGPGGGAVVTVKQLAALGVG